MPAEIRRHWTADAVRDLVVDWNAWPRYELINGELLVTPSGTFAHQMAVAELLALLRSYCEASGVGIALTSPADIGLEEDSIVQPDVFVVPEFALPEDESDMTWKHVRSLLLAVEVISPSSARSDRVEKRDFYLSHGVAEYWVVDVSARAFEVWTVNRATPRIERANLQWHPLGTTEPLELDIAQFFAAMKAKLRRT